MANYALSHSIPPGKNATKISIFNFLAFVPIYKNATVLLLLFCKFNFLLKLPSSCLTRLSSVDIYPNNRELMAPLGNFNKEHWGRPFGFLASHYLDNIRTLHFYFFIINIGRK